MASCPHKHTTYQPTRAEYRCPRCGAPSGHFGIDETPADDCPRLHTQDRLMCYGPPKSDGCPARYRTTGAAFARLVQRRKEKMS